MSIFKKIPQALLPWYYENRRELPWRRDKEPYHIWLSEIMLQQTRVEAVKGYYQRFLAALPTVGDLAKCDDDALHKLWEGLGYYSRVRNLKKAAQLIVDAGEFPREYADVQALPGVGEYTAGAICSIAYDQPTPAVDGNVLRVISRLTQEETPIDSPVYKASVRQKLMEIYPAEAGDFTQALMELGATVCGPNRKPDCENCPCREFCGSAIHGTAEKYPVRAPKRAKREEEKTVFILSCDELFAIEKRENSGLLAGLWQFPNVSGKLETEQALEAVEKMGLRPKNVIRRLERSHIFTHIIWQMRGYYLEVDAPEGDFTWLTRAEIEADAALPTAFRQFF